MNLNVTSYVFEELISVLYYSVIVYGIRLIKHKYKHFSYFSIRQNVHTLLFLREHLIFTVLIVGS